MNYVLHRQVSLVGTFINKANRCWRDPFRSCLKRKWHMICDTPEWNVKFKFSHLNQRTFMWLAFVFGMWVRVSTCGNKPWHLNFTFFLWKTKESKAFVQNTLHHLMICNTSLKKHNVKQLPSTLSYRFYRLAYLYFILKAVS